MGSRNRGRSIGSADLKLRGPFQHQSLDVVSVPVASCGGRMPECASTGCWRERFAFVAFLFAIGTIRWLRGVFVLVLPCFKAPWSLESQLVS